MYTAAEVQLFEAHGQVDIASTPPPYMWQRLGSVRSQAEGFLLFGYAISIAVVVVVVVMVVVVVLWWWWWWWWWSCLGGGGGPVLLVLVLSCWWRFALVTCASAYAVTHS